MRATVTAAMTSCPIVEVEAGARPFPAFQTLSISNPDRRNRDRNEPDPTRRWIMGLTLNVRPARGARVRSERVRRRQIWATVVEPKRREARPASISSELLQQRGSASSQTTTVAPCYDCWLIYLSAHITLRQAAGA